MTIVSVSVCAASEASEGQRALAEASGDRTVELPFDALLDDPVPTLAHVLARIGESADDGPLRVLVENYPGRKRHWCVAPTEDRTQRTARTSDDSVRSAPREVSP